MQAAYWILFAALLCTVSAIGTGDLVNFIYPSWIVPTDQGTVCACVLTATPLWASVAGRNLAFNLYSTVDSNYTCSCATAINISMNGMVVSASLVGNYTELCSDSGITATAPFPTGDDIPLCTDFLGNTCGGAEGVIDVTRTEYSTGYAASINETSATFIEGAQTATFCTKVRTRIKCITPACTQGLQDCVLNNTYSEWSECVASSGSCVKRREKKIIVNSTGGGVPCPSFQDRTQTIACLTEECNRVSCAYTTYTVKGTCNTTCGLGYLTETVYNVSYTPLSVCGIGNNTVISTRLVPCGFYNLPCSASNATQPISVTCAITGNQGRYGNAPRYIRINFGATVVSNHTNNSLAASLDIRVQSSGLPFYIAANESYFSGSYLYLKLLIANDNCQGLTGETFNVTYSSIVGSHGALLVGEVPIPVFSCLTTDESPPVAIYAMGDTPAVYISGRAACLVFSERIFNGGDLPGTNINANQVIFSGGSGTAIFGEAIGVTTNNRYACDFFTETDPDDRWVWSANSYAKLNLSVPCEIVDSNGNYANISGYNDPVPFWIFTEDGNYSLPAGCGGTARLISNNTENVLDTAIISHVLPINSRGEGVNLGDEFVAELTATYENSDYLVTLGSSQMKCMEAYPYTEPGPVACYTWAVTLGVQNDTVLSRQAFLPSNAILTKFSVTPPTALIDAFNQPTYTWYATGPLPPFADMLTEGPRVIQALISPNSTDMMVNFSFPRQSGALFRANDFLVAGTSIHYSVDSILNQTADSLWLRLSSKITIDDIETGALVYQDSENTALRKVTQVDLSSLVGPRPEMISINTAAAPGSKVWTEVKISFDSDVSSIENLLDSVVFNSTNPQITSIVPTSATVAESVATVKIAVSCLDECSDTGTSISVVSKDVIGANGISSRSTGKIVPLDNVKPTLTGAFEVGAGEIILTVSEKLQDSDVAIEMLPEGGECQVIPENEIVCIFGGEVTANSLAILEDSAVVGLDGIESNGYVGAPVVPRKCGSCTIGDLSTWWMVYSIFALVSFGASIVGASAYGLYRVCGSPKMAE